MSFSLLYPACLLANLNNEEQMLLWRSKALRIQVLAAFYNQKKACEKPQKQNVVTLLTFKVAWYSPIF